MSMDLLIAIIGWVFIYDISSRTIKRSEVSRLKDSIVIKAEELLTWYSGEARSDTPLSPPQLEAAFAGRIFHLQQKLDNYCAFTRISVEQKPKHIERLHCFYSAFEPNDIDSKLERVHNLSEQTFDFIEHIEREYNQYINQSLKNTFSEILPISLGALVATSALYSSFLLLSFILSPLK